MILSFELSMPNCASWNGKWSGEGTKYVRIVNVGASKKARDRYAKLIGSHRYDFGDGWAAAVSVREVDAAEARKLRRASAGFCGYDWMIESLRDHGKILNTNQRRELAQAAA